MPGRGIHPTALVDPGARVDPSATVGAWTIVGPGVEVGRDVRIGAHVLIERDSWIGEGCRIHHGAVLGSAPQDLKYAGEPTRLEVGPRTVIREYCTLNRATAATAVTRVGADCLLMAYTHVAHDCRVGDHAILANAVQLGGHSEIGDWAILGGMTGVHQFTRVGPHAFLGGCSRVVQDVPPFLMAVGNPCEPHGINVVGLRRRGFEPASIEGLRKAYRTLFKSRTRNLGQALDDLEADGAPDPTVAELIAFIRASERGIIT
ncbi:MAG: acyl-ACP--UDP-N-acetylglucosamine O-acyltransferase [Gemmatimonadota bacterium]